MKDHNKLDFNELYDDFSKLVLHVAFDRIKDYHLSEDIAQEVFLKLDRHLYHLHSKEHVKAWLIKVASNEAVSFMRKYYDTKYVNLPLDKETEERLFEDTIEKNIAFWDAQNKLDMIFEKMYRKNKRWYYVTVESLYGSMTTDELSKFLHVSRNAITSLQYRARKWLKEELLLQSDNLRQEFDAFINEDNDDKNVDN